MSVLLLPTLGSLHLLHPRYNAVTLLELTRAFRPDEVLLASYSEEGLQAGVWRDEEELGLYHLLPWSERAGVPVSAIGEGAEELKAEAERFRDYLDQMERGRTYLREEAAWREELTGVLARPLTPASWRLEEPRASLERYLSRVAERFGEGPATGFREARMRKVAEAIRSRPPARRVVWVELLDFPVLLRHLPEAELPGEHEPTRAESERALLDRAWRLEEADDLAALLTGLREIGSAEAGYLAAQVYLAAGQPADALTLLEQVVAGDFHEPGYLPGYVLARLGQLRDLLGDREGALRAYRGVLALSWAPEEARAVASAGLRSPFRVLR